MRKPKLRQRLRYRFDNTMSKGAPALVTWLVLITFALVAIAGTLVVFISPQTDEEGNKLGFFDSLWTSLLHVLDPGTVTGDEPTGVFVIIMMAVTIGGIVIVSSLVGILTTGLDDKLTDLRKGRSLVVETGHTVVLGWSDQIFTVISELVEANESERRACIAILADRDKVEMEDEIKAKLGSTKTTKVVCRTGNPVDPDDIRIVNPDAAKSIILLTSGEPDPDAQLVKSLLAVTHGNPDRTNPYHVVASVAESRNLPAAQLAGGREAQIIDADDVTARLMVQTCRQSGLSVVYTDLLDFGGDEIYLTEEPRLVGYSFGQAQLAYRKSSVIGIQTPDAKCHLNPSPRTMINPGDRLILIAEDDSAIHLDGSQPSIVEQGIVARGKHSARPERTLIMGWNARAGSILRQLDAYVSPGSSADVVTDHPNAAANLTDLGHQMKVLGLNYKTDDTTDRRTLEGLNVGVYDHIIVLCCDNVPAQLADSRTLVTLLHLRDMAEKTGAKYPVVSEMSDDRNRGLAQVTQADDFIVSEKLISLMLTQIAENPHLAAVFADLFDPDGSEIYLKPAEYYVRMGTQLPFYTVAESAKRRNETAIGYRLAAEAQIAPTYGVHLNPDKAEAVVLGPNDRVIVLAED